MIERVLNLFYVINKLYKNRPPRHHTDYIYIRHMCVFRWLCRKVFLTGHKILIVLILYMYFSDYYYKRGWISNSHDMIVSIKLTRNYFWVVYSRLIMFWYFFQGRYSLKYTPICKHCAIWMFWYTIAMTHEYNGVKMR